jgi:hypothetical protein
MARYSKIKKKQQVMSAFRKPEKCKTTYKTRYATHDLASQGMMRAWGHDPKMDIMAYHVYQCPACHGFHFGNQKVYEKYVKPTEIEITDSVTTLVD